MNVIKLTWLTGFGLCRDSNRTLMAKHALNALFQQVHGGHRSRSRASNHRPRAWMQNPTRHLCFSTSQQVLENGDLTAVVTYFKHLKQTVPICNSQTGEPQRATPLWHLPLAVSGSDLKWRLFSSDGAETGWTTHNFQTHERFHPRTASCITFQLVFFSEFCLSFSLINEATQARSQWASSSSSVLQSHRLEVRAALLCSHSTSSLPGWGRIEWASSITLTMIYSPCVLFPLKKNEKKKNKKKRKWRTGGPA